MGLRDISMRLRRARAGAQRLATARQSRKIAQLLSTDVCRHPPARGNALIDGSPPNVDLISGEAAIA